MDQSVKLEFLVEMTCKSCIDDIHNALKNVPGVHQVKINLDKKQVLVDTELPSARIQELIEETGRKAALFGVGVEQASGTVPTVAAVAIVSGNSRQKGVVRFVASDDEVCIIDGTVDGLQPGVQYSLRVHEYGDLSDGCDSCGDVYRGSDDRPPDVEEIHCAVATDKGRADFRYELRPLHLWELIGRSVVVHESCSDGTDKRVLCGIIARSSGLFQNSKRICVCSGATVWDEREVARS